MKEGYEVRTVELGMLPDEWALFDEIMGGNPRQDFSEKVRAVFIMWMNEHERRVRVSSDFRSSTLSWESWQAPVRTRS